MEFLLLLKYVQYLTDSGFLTMMLLKSNIKQ